MNSACEVVDVPGGKIEIAQPKRGRLSGGCTNQLLLRADGDPGNTARYQSYQEHGGKQAFESPGIEPPRVEASVDLDFSQDEARYQVPGKHEEDVYTNISAGKPGNLRMSGNYQGNCQCTQTLYVGAMSLGSGSDEAGILVQVHAPVGLSIDKQQQKLAGEEGLIVVCHPGMIKTLHRAGTVPSTH